MNFLNCPLFQGVTQTEIEKMMDCFNGKAESFAEGKTIISYAENSDSIGVLLDGVAVVRRIGRNGDLSVQELLVKNGLFGEVFCFGAAKDTVEVVAVEKCTVVFIDKMWITRPCANACGCHLQIIQNLYFLLSEKVQRLSEKVELLSKRSIRQKLLYFFHRQCAQEGTDTFLMPFPFSSLAEYVNADRSAMMRELKKMREDGLVRINGRSVTLLQRDREEE